MAERGRRLNKSIALKALCLVVVIFTAFCCMACGFHTIYAIPDYEEFLVNYEKYATVNSGFRGENIDGFMPIINSVFDYGTAFSGNVAYVESKTEKYILNGVGDLKATAIDVADKTLKEGKFVFKSGGKYGVMNAFGEVLLNAEYNNVDIIGNTILVTLNNEALSYSAAFDSKYAVMLGITRSNNVTLLSDEYTSVDGRICDSEFNVCEIDGLRYAYIPQEGKVVLILSDGSLRFYDVRNKSFIGDSYAVATPFCNGTAVVRTDDGRNVIINESGIEIYSDYDMQFGDSYCGYRVFKLNGVYGIMDDNFNIVLQAQENAIRYNRAVSAKFIIEYANCSKIFSPQSGAYSVEFDDITYSGGLFFCVKNNETVVLDEDLKELIVCEYAAYSCGVLTIKNNGKFAYYVRNTSAR